MHNRNVFMTVLSSFFVASMVKAHSVGNIPELSSGSKSRHVSEALYAMNVTHDRSIQMSFSVENSSSGERGGSDADKGTTTKFFQTPPWPPRSTNVDCIELAGGGSIKVRCYLESFSRVLALGWRCRNFLCDDSIINPKERKYLLQCAN